MNRHSLGLFTILAISALGTSAASQTAGSPRPDFVLITIDTLRADHLGSYGYPRDTSPNIDRFAEGAVLFEHTVAPMPMTLPSHVSLLTSSLPVRHGVMSNFRFLEIPFVPGEEDGIQSAAQTLANAGYTTAAFTSASPLSRGTGIDVGFETFEAPPPYGEQGESVRVNAEATINRAIAWLQTAPTPFFLWVHVFDPHLPYQPPPPHDRQFQTDDALLERLRESGIPEVLLRYAAQATNAYDGEIHFVDQQLGRLFDALRARGTWEEGVIALTADHGEGLLEHGDPGHQFLWRGTIGVPLILRWPAGPRGLRENQLASLIDVLPTLAANTALPLGDRFDGIDLLAPSAHAPREALVQEPVYSSAPRMRTWALITPDWKLWHRPGLRDELFQPGEDPAEREEKSAQHEAVVRQMRLRVEALVEEASARPGARVQEQTDPALRARLRELGYAE
jgi:arylsulfatase A-like enzyme